MRRVWLWVSLGATAAVAITIWGAMEEINGNLDPSGSGSSSFTIVGSNKVVTASDRMSQITEPASWQYTTAVRGPQPNIEESNLGQDQYFAVFRTPKENLDDFEEFQRAAGDHLRTELRNATFGDPHQLTIGALPAVQYTVEGKLATGTPVYYWITLVNGNRGYYELLGWTSAPPTFQAENTIQDIIQSFRELGAS